MVVSPVHQKFTKTRPFSPSFAMVRRWPSGDAERWTRAFVSEACQDTQILAIVAFGSAIRETVHSADIDLLLVHTGEMFAPPPSPLDVDVRLFSESDLDKKLALGHDLLAWALRFGKVICEKEEFWTSLRERWQPCLPLPSATDAEERAARLHSLYKKMLAIGDLDAAHEQHLAELTQVGRSRLIRAGVYPASRPELPEQLRQIGEEEMANSLDTLLRQRFGEPL